MLQQLQLLLLVLRPCRVLELVLMLVLVLVLRPGLLLLLLLRLLILLHIGIVIGIVVIGAGIGIVMSFTTASSCLRHHIGIFSTSSGSSENSARDSGALTEMVFLPRILFFSRVLENRPYTKESKIKKKPL